MLQRPNTQKVKLAFLFRNQQPVDGFAFLPEVYLLCFCVGMVDREQELQEICTRAPIRPVLEKSVACPSELSIKTFRVKCFDLLRKIMYQSLWYADAYITLSNKTVYITLFGKINFSRNGFLSTDSLHAHEEVKQFENCKAWI